MKRFVVALCGLALLITGCRDGGSERPAALRLVDNFDTEMVKNVPTQVTRPKPAGLWQFSTPAEDATATLGWKAATGVSSLRIEDGRLHGRTTTDFPIVYVELKEGLDSIDLLHAVEIRMRVSKGANLSASSNGSDDLKVDQFLKRGREVSQPWDFNVPLVVSENIETYTLTPPRNARLSSIHKLLIRPSDAAGADFEIESVKIVSR